MKSIFKSKTIWVALLYAALMGFSPVVQAYTNENPGIIGCSVAFVFIFLRIVTKNKVTLWPKKPGK